MSDASTNFGIQLLKSDMEVTPTFSTIGEVTNIDLPEYKNDTVEATHHGSTAREWISGNLLDVTEFTATVNFVEAGFTAIHADLISGEPIDYQIVFPDAGAVTWAFSAIVKSIKPAGADAKSPEALAMDVVFQPSGDMNVS